MAIDVLQQVKELHLQTRALVASLVDMADLESTNKFKTTNKSYKAILESLQKQLDSQFAIEESLLYPEVSDLLPSSAKLFAEASVSRKQIRIIISKIQNEYLQGQSKENVSENTAQLQTRLEDHLRMTEEHIMPRMRAGLPTSYREDLGLVFNDLLSSAS